MNSTILQMKNLTLQKHVMKQKVTATIVPIKMVTLHVVIYVQPALAPATKLTKDTVAALNANHVLTLQRTDYSSVLVSLL